MGADIPAAAFVLILLILWCETIETNSESTDTYALLSVLAVYIVTVKFSCALFSLLFVYPAYLLIKEKNTKKIILCILLGLIVAIPFFIRTVFITGWLIFPFSSIDLFNFDWKVPKQIVDYESELITMYARLPNDMAWAYEHKTAFEWIPRWFADQSISDLLLFFINILFILIELITFTVKLIKKQSISLVWSITKTVIIICFAYWFFCAPAFRFGWSSMLFFPAVTLGSLIKFKKHHALLIPPICFAGIIMILIYIGFKNSEYRNIDIAESLAENPYIMQIDYQQIDSTGTFTLEDNNTIFYLPSPDGVFGYYNFPSAIIMNPEKSLMLRGTTIEDGFCFR